MAERNKRERVFTEVTCSSVQLSRHPASVYHAKDNPIILILNIHDKTHDGKYTVLQSRLCHSCRSDQKGSGRPLT